MKKSLFLLLVMAAVTALGCAQGETALPDAVAALCRDVHPGYEIAGHDGWGDERCGQFALVLKQGEDNILCIAEKAQEDAAYQFTVDNTNAVYDGDILPGLLIDSGGDALFYTYQDEAGNSEHYHTIKQDGRWLEMDVTLYESAGDEIRSINSGVHGGYLRYQAYTEDENGNILDGFDYAPIPVGAAFEEAILIENFNIEQYNADPVYGLYQASKMPGFAEAWLSGVERLISIDLKPECAVLLLEAEGGEKFLRIAQLEDGLYRISQMGPLSADMGMDAFHSDEDGLILTRNGGMTLYSFALAQDGTWQMTYVQGREGIALLHDGVYSMDSSVLLRNDDVVYGVHPWGDLLNINFDAVPETLEAAAAVIDQHAYALVHNPNPSERLHLRTRPDKGAASLGKFYNRTPVLVLERGDTWTKVRIGSDAYGLTGYMMTQYLAFGEKEKAALACAFPQKLLREEYPDGVYMYAEPKYSAAITRVFAQERHDFIIGVAGDDWYVVSCADGTVGYVPQNAFWDGNG